METKKFTQFGTLSVLTILPLFLLFAILLIKSGVRNSPDFYIHIVTVPTLLICLLIFYKLTIIVDAETVSFRLGIGLVRKSYKISEIKSCRPVKNHLLTGIGARILPNGRLYNVTGLKAIELHFKYKSSVVRLGTNKPEEVSQLIQSLIAGEEIVRNATETSTKNRMNSIWIASFLLIVALAIIPNYQDTKVEWDDNELKIKGVYGMTIPYNEIEQADTLLNIPAISTRTNGYAFGRTLIGNFKLADEGHSKLFIKKGNPPYIIILSQGRVPIYINFKDNQKTMELYHTLRNGE